MMLFILNELPKNKDLDTQSVICGVEGERGEMLGYKNLVNECDRQRIAHATACNSSATIYSCTVCVFFFCVIVYIFYICIYILFRL